ncbi:MAG: MFS transporter [Clostridia bacterium]|nr:MFS transporter [Clostridia bacterium]
MSSSPILEKLKKHALIRDLIELEGNPRYCVYLEPLWGIPYNLYSPFATLFMYNLGVRDREIGLLLSIGMVLQVLSSLLGGVLCDKWGRRKTTVIFDTLSWSVPCLIWMLAQNFYWFLAATIFNAMWQITNNSWSCLLVEDCDPRKLVNVYTWVNVAGLLAVFFAPVSTALVAHYSLIPVMRILYFLSFVMMTAKFWILYWKGHETRQGLRRMEETKHVPLRSLFLGYGNLLREILHTKATLFLLAVMILCNITSTLTGTFYSLRMVDDLGIQEAFIAVFPMVRAAVMLLFIFVWQSKINAMRFRPPMVAGLLLFITGQLLLAFAPGGAGVLTWSCLLLYILADAFANAIFMPRKDSLTALCVDPQQRARIYGLLYVLMIGLCSPFGYIGGLLSSLNRALPFLFNACLYLILLLLVILTPVLKKISDEVSDPAE